MPRTKQAVTCRNASFLFEQKGFTCSFQCKTCSNWFLQKSEAPRNWEYDPEISFSKIFASYQMPNRSSSSVASPSSSAMQLRCTSKAPSFTCKVRMFGSCDTRQFSAGPLLGEKNNKLRKKCRWQFMTIPPYSNIFQQCNLFGYHSLFLMWHP